MMKKREEEWCRGNRWICTNLNKKFCMRFLCFKYYLDCCWSIFHITPPARPAAAACRFLDSYFVRRRLLVCALFPPKTFFLFVWKNYHKYICIYSTIFPFGVWDTLCVYSMCVYISPDRLFVWLFLVAVCFFCFRCCVVVAFGWCRMDLQLRLWHTYINEHFAIKNED